MRSYTPIFDSIVDSSLWEEPLHVRVVFLTMLSLQDWDHIVRVETHHLRRKANLDSDKLLLDALKVLSEPDRRTTIPQPFDGRRIEKVEGGWFILNGKKYQEEMRRANLRAKWARQKREKRARKALLNGSSGPSGEEIRHVKEFEEGIRSAEQLGDRDY